MYRSNAPHILAVVQVEAWGRQFTVDTVGATAARYFQVPSSSPAVLGRRSLEAGVAAAQVQVQVQVKLLQGGRGARVPPA